MVEFIAEPLPFNDAPERAYYLQTAGRGVTKRALDAMPAKTWESRCGLDGWRTVCRRFFAYHFAFSAGEEWFLAGLKAP
jgi:hypothetical protein